MSVLRIEPNAINSESSYTFGNVTVAGNILVSGSIVPTSNNTVNLGAPDRRFGTLYISANTIDLGGATITGTGDTIQFVTTTGNLVVDANTINFLGNVSSQGPESARGYTGSAGINGFTGSQGAVGFVGSAGSAGAVGFTGSRGIDGIIGVDGYTGSKGDTGLGFTIAKTYANVAALTADTSPTGIVAGQFALIDTGNVNDPENSRLYLWTGSAYNYVNDLSGAAGITGPQGTTGFTGSAGAQGIVGFTGSAGTGGGGGGGAIYSRSSIIATAGQTVFNVAYTIGYLQVYLNGALLNDVDYTATNGSTVTLTDAAAADDLLEFITYSTVSVADVSTATFNSTNITSNLAITAGYSAVSVGPLSIAANVVISIASGQKWVIL